MGPHTKFRENRSIFRKVMTFRIFSRWLPSAILNFQKFKFWINYRGRSQNLRRHTKFGKSWMIGGWDIAIKPKSNMAAAAMLSLLPVYFLTHFEDYEGKVCLHTKFHTNRTIFGEVITFHKFFKMAVGEVTWHQYLQFWTTYAVADVFQTCCWNFILTLIILTPKRHKNRWKRVIQGFDLGACPRKKVKTGQHNQKRHKTALYFTYVGRSPR